MSASDNRYSWGRSRPRALTGIDGFEAVVRVRLEGTCRRLRQRGLPCNECCRRPEGELEAASWGCRRGR